MTEQELTSNIEQQKSIIAKLERLPEIEKRFIKYLQDGDYPENIDFNTQIHDRLHDIELRLKINLYYLQDIIHDYNIENAGFTVIN